MIKKVIVTNPNGENLELDLYSPEESGLIVKSIDGLGPVKSKINITSSPTVDVSKFNSAHLNVRNIVFKFQYLSNPTIEDTRQMTYQFFPVKRPIHLAFETDNHYLGCEGYVESNEPDIFSKDSGCTISIVCPDPYFYDERNRVISNTYKGITQTFMFKKNNTVFTKDPDNIMFGSIEQLPIQIVDNLGDSESGIKITLYATDTVLNPFVVNLETETKMTLMSKKIENITGKGFISGDTIEIITDKGNKSIRLYRGYKKYNIISALKDYNSWIYVGKGRSRFTFGADSNYYRLNVQYSYTGTYEGI